VERHRLLQAQRSLSFSDVLTGLYNRRGFAFLAHKQLKAARRTGNAACLLFMDLDDLKRINDSLGHLEGDRALVDTASILTATFRRGTDMAARLGGDEFAVLAFTEKRKTCAVLEEMLDRGVEAFNALKKRPYRLSLSVGTIRCDPDDPGCIYDIDKLMAQADRLMYERKFQKRADRRAVP
jgi:two-component system cell cycle response regulator